MDLQSAFSARRGGMAPPRSADRLKRMCRYWQNIRGDRLMPARADFDPVDVPDLLPFIGLIDVFRDDPDALNFQVRLVGTALGDVAGVRLTGRQINTQAAGGPFSDGTVGYFRWACQTCVDTRTPVAARALIYMENGDPAPCGVLLLPMGNSDQAVDKILMIADVSAYSAIQHGPVTNIEFDWQD